MSKNLNEVFETQNIKVCLKDKKPYIEVDGVRTYIFSGGKISQNAIEAVLRLKAQKTRSNTAFENLRDFIEEQADAGVDFQDGNRLAEIGVKEYGYRDDSALLLEILGKIYKGDEEKIQKTLELGKRQGSKNRLKVDEKFV